MMVMPGTTFAAHSLAASSALTPALAASILLCTCSATLQAPITVPFASSRSSAISSTRSTPGFGCQERILDRRRFGLRIEDLERLPDLVFSPHLAAERDRERAGTQDDDRRRGARVRRQERVCERKRESGVGIVGVHHLAMTCLQHSRPVRPVGWRCRGLCAHRRRRKPREHHRAGEAAEETSAGHLVIYVVREIAHVVLHFLHLRQPSVSKKRSKEWGPRR